MSKDLVTDNPAILIYQLGSTFDDASEEYELSVRAWTHCTEVEKEDWCAWVLRKGRWEGRK